MSFDEALTRAASFGPEIHLSNDAKLMLYGLFKQASKGDADEEYAPSRLNIVASAKFKAWLKLKGMSKEQAQREYVTLVSQLDPSWIIQERKNDEINGSSHDPKVVERGRVSKQSEISSNQGSKPIQLLEQTEGNGEMEEKLNHSLPKHGISAPELSATKPPERLRRKSLDKNFKPKLSNTLERILNNQEDSFLTGRIRGQSLESALNDSNVNFLISPLAHISTVSEQVLQLALKDGSKEDFYVSQEMEGASILDTSIQSTVSRIYDHLVGVGNVRDLGKSPSFS